MAKKYEPNGSQKLPKWSSKPSQTESIRGQEGARTAQKLKKHVDATQKWMGAHRVAPFYSKMCSTWVQLRFQNGAKTDKKIYAKIDSKIDAFENPFFE